MQPRLVRLGIVEHGYALVVVADGEEEGQVPADDHEQRGAVDDGPYARNLLQRTAATRESRVLIATLTGLLMPLRV